MLNKTAKNMSANTYIIYTTSPILNVLRISKLKRILSMSLSKSDIENILQFEINDIEHYKRAFVHKSASQTASNERLEFLGDAILNMITTKYLYDKYPEMQEGYLTKKRIHIVRGESLAILSKELGLYKFLVMDETAKKNNWNCNDKILENAFEALIGSIFSDKGFESCERFIIRMIKRVENITETIDNKDNLMKLCHSKKFELPKYALIFSCVNKFHVKISVNAKTVSEGFGKTKKMAEQNAAKNAMTCLCG
jgi:ribonuclease-3